MYLEIVDTRFLYGGTMNFERINTHGNSAVKNEKEVTLKELVDEVGGGASGPGSLRTI